MIEPIHPMFPHMFQPYRLKGVTLRNRIAVSGHFAFWWVDKGLPSAEFAAYIEERARGGVGLFVIGATSPERGSGWLESLNDDIIPRYKMLVEAGHRHGTAIFAQLCHPGYQPLPGAPIGGMSIHASGTQPSYRSPERFVPAASDLKRLIASFAAAAGRAVAGGVDGIEIHSHESFLHAQMLNPIWNSREDEYGGSLENRLRFMTETLQAIRNEIGWEIPLGIRLKLDDVEQRGMNSDDYIQATKLLEATGLLDYVNFSGGDGRFHHGPMSRPEGEWLGLMSKMRSAVGLTLMHTGRITTPEMAEQALKENVADVLCMTKTHICDPHFTRKVQENRLQEIRFCTRCLQSCHGKMHLMTCVYNPLTSRELEWSERKPAAVKKRVVIVGAGPAGMESALNAAERGHEVFILEKSDKVGGQVLLGCSSPLRKQWGRIADFYDRQGKRGIFDVRLNTHADVQAILDLKPDVVILATGSVPNRHRLTQELSPTTVHEVLAGELDHAKHVVLYDRENFMRPFVAADWLSSRGIKVEFVAPYLSIGDTMDGNMRAEMLAKLTEQGVSFHPGYEAISWDDPSKASVFRCRNVQTAEDLVFENADGFVATVGSTSWNPLESQLRGKVLELYVIGDANLPQTVEAATYQGARIGRLI